MAVEIGTLVLKGRFGAQSQNNAVEPADFERRIEELRQDVMREVEFKLEEAARRAWER